MRPTKPDARATGSVRRTGRPSLEAAGGAVLGIETSCDETAAAVVVDGVDIASSVVSSQVDLHTLYGGVVPEVASRAHLDLLVPLVTTALSEAEVEGRGLSGVAVTSGPGLAGALMVGVATAKALAVAWDVPFVAVNHLEAHLFAAGLDGADVPLPVVTVLASGGHTMLVVIEAPGRYRLLGQTLDDAAGEAFDKVARFLGLGYPGGPVVDRMAQEGDPRSVDFPRPLLHQGWDFSFSGLKSAVLRYTRLHPDAPTADVAASFQAAVVDVLVSKAVRAVRETGAAGICLAGGVAANSELRRRTTEACESMGVRALLPERAMCTDNAAMVAAAGWWRLAWDGPSSLETGAEPDLPLLTA